MFTKLSRKKQLGGAIAPFGFAVFVVAWGISWYRRETTSSAMTSCLANLKMIEGSKATWALENKKEEWEVPKETELFGPNAYVREKPVCPSGGAYTLGALREPATCFLGMTNENHRLPGVGKQIR